MDDKLKAGVIRGSGVPTMRIICIYIYIYIYIGIYIGVPLLVGALNPNPPGFQGLGFRVRVT